MSLKNLTISEMIALLYLIEKYPNLSPKDVLCHKHSQPDFVLPNGTAYEVKRPVGNYRRVIKFNTASQQEWLTKDIPDTWFVLVVWNDGESEHQVTEIRINDLKKHYERVNSGFVIKYTPRNEGELIGRAYLQEREK